MRTMSSRRAVSRAIALASAGLTIAIVCLTGYLFLVGSLSIWGGTLPSAKSDYLDGTGHMFQRGGWHLGNALRTRGETYGIKMHRFYLTVCVKHVDPRVSPEEANE